MGLVMVFSESSFGVVEMYNLVLFPKLSLIVLVAEAHSARGSLLCHSTGS